MKYERKDEGRPEREQVESTDFTDGRRLETRKRQGEPWARKAKGRARLTTVTSDKWRVEKAGSGE